jgi:hypothetical protein
VTEYIPPPEQSYGVPLQSPVTEDIPPPEQSYGVPLQSPVTEYIPPPEQSYGVPLQSPVTEYIPPPEQSYGVPLQSPVTEYIPPPEPSYGVPLQSPIVEYLPPAEEEAEYLPPPQSSPSEQVVRQENLRTKRIDEGFRTGRTCTSHFTLLRRYNMNGRSQIWGGKNGIFAERDKCKPVLLRLSLAEKIW